MTDYHYQRCSLIRVVDGDTVKLRVDMGFGTMKEEMFRLAGLDCPEMKTSEGVQAKLCVEGWFTKRGGVCSLVSHGQDKYGRWLATIYNCEDAGDTLNGALIATGNASEYHGEKR